jgi:hypothetical protein
MREFYMLQKIEAMIDNTRGKDVTESCCKLGWAVMCNMLIISNMAI